MAYFIMTLICINFLSIWFFIIFHDEVMKYFKSLNMLGQFTSLIIIGWIPSLIMLFYFSIELGLLLFDNIFKKRKYCNTCCRYYK